MTTKAELFVDVPFRCPCGVDESEGFVWPDGTRLCDFCAVREHGNVVWEKAFSDLGLPIPILVLEI